MKVKVNWIENNDYNAKLSVGERKITSNMNDPEGMKPPELILSALATCGGLFLKPQFNPKSIELKSLAIETDAKKATPPNMFKSINMHYIVESNISDDELEQMIIIANKNCIVKNTLNPNIAITFSFEIIKK
ncbi:MAG: hypothetical protein B6I28_01780 [Fusobacteriia bacterium 4572_132]|nr:MAG: hypothetical protein B6I28_01780 [Fusobacteriia bacterium 4572_132]